MNRSVSLCLLLVTAFASVSRAADEIHVRIWFRACGGGGWSDHYFDEDEAITFTNINSCVERINIWATSSNHDIGRVSLSGAGGANVFVVIGAAGWNGNDTGMAQAAKDWAGLSASSSVEPWLYLEGHIGGDLTDSIKVGRLYRFDVDGEVQDGIQSTQSSPGFFAVNAGSVLATGDLRADNASIKQVLTDGSCSGSITAANAGITNIIVGGNLLGDVYAKGRIETINTTGDIGTSSAPITITTESHEADIDLIKAARIYADIVMPNSANPRGDVDRIETTTGVFKGSLRCYAMQPQTGSTNDTCLSIAGNLDADLDVYTIKRAVTIGGSIPAGRLIRVGADIKADAPVTIGAANGLGGQIIIEDDLNAGSAAWSGSLTVNGVALAIQPYYSNTSANVGGGAVGLVPYHLYDNDCDPVNNATTPGEIFDSQFNGIVSSRAAKLRFYGPVYDADSGDKPVVVEVFTGSIWTDVTENVRVTVQSSASTNVREITLDRNPTKPALMWGPYRVTPVSGDLLCAGTTGSTIPAVASYTYYFNLVRDCNTNLVDDIDEAGYTDEHGHYIYDMNRDLHLDECGRDGSCLPDIDGDGFLTGADYDFYVIFYEDGYAPLADFDNDGFVTGIDYDLYVDAYEAGCT